MTKKEIVKAISEEIGLTQLKTKEIVQKTFDAIIDTLVEDPSHRIELRNFGVFEVKRRAPRKARNPRTGERVDVAEKYVVTFKPGKEMEERVGMISEKEAEKIATETIDVAPHTPSPATHNDGNHTPPASGQSVPETRTAPAEVSPYNSSYMK